MLPAVHRLGLLQRAGGQHRPRDPEGQPGQRRPPPQVSRLLTPFHFFSPNILPVTTQPFCYSCHPARCPLLLSLLDNLAAFVGAALPSSTTYHTPL